jgi:diaminohydroxyphosphoribosylaminopyrimidine deaminase/5-amino-6-(5-phosphoribosylamino)uracil reductase
VNDIDYMQRALALAQPMVGQTGENPAVGCVIVKDSAIVGEAATGASGRPHAEEKALAQAGPRAAGASVYVTLEPCNERSLGGVSCTDLLIAGGVARVVIACADPHPLAQGAGLKRLADAQVGVELGLCRAEALAQNQAFIARWSQA